MDGIVIFNTIKDVSMAAIVGENVKEMRVILGEGFKELAFVAGDLSLIFLGFKAGKEFIDKEEENNGRRS